MNITRNKRFALLVGICLVFFVIFLSSLFLTGGEKTKEEKPQTARPVVDTRGNIVGSKFNQVIPGKTTGDELINQEGAPEESEIDRGLEKLLFFDRDELYNYAWEKDGVVVVTKENLFENSKADDFITMFGNPNIKLYHMYSEDLMWYIFLPKGIGIQVSQSDNQVTGLVRFQPQSRESFIINVAPLVGMTTQKEDLIAEPE
ncbi:MAG: hypothetical protein HY344_05060 [Candidatus Levybacteria bacterium]|nr:hypothetical protein [Candidatus Levybacteria bacterium]